MNPLVYFQQIVGHIKGGRIYDADIPNSAHQGLGVTTLDLNNILSYLSNNSRHSSQCLHLNAKTSYENSLHGSSTSTEYHPPKCEHTSGSNRSSITISDCPALTVFTACTRRSSVDSGIIRRWNIGGIRVGRL
jgi:hypothetical protein